MSGGKLNPIQLRLRRLEGLWNTFSESAEPRILRWLTDTDEQQMVQLFVDLQSEEASEIPDLFLELRAVLNTASDWTTALVAELSEKHAAERSGLESLGLVAAWTPPEVPVGGGPEYLVQACDTFYRQLVANVAERLVVVLSPVAVMQSPEWPRWLDQLAQQKIPATLRFMVVDCATTPQLESVARAHSSMICTIRPELEMERASEEILDAVPGDSPGHQFRRYFVALTSAAGRADTAAAEAAGQKAVDTALGQHWHGLAATAQMAIAAAWFSAGRLEESIVRYRQACQTAEVGEDLASRNLRVPARMAAGSALIAANRFAEAADTFELAAADAEANENPPQQLEAWRMAGWCHEQARQPRKARHCGEKSLQASTGMDEDQRRLSHLPWVGQMLLRLADSDRDREWRRQTERQMLELLGPEWAAPLALGRT